ncbi:hypothetical protein [Streptomyces botrytidirepellens]|uniref:Uncharacterized protein n=1 Tax=Streptomyces botrytidirepellens TaxID=2486417 RepID=A0A3M8VJJ8_9ACTN|nr:hypothetical protein [Streptomyces botrytidirepellens]RNG17852.1 hypothetical protein EEJ42_29115 [Streptomyces botrytidirepellens]
MAIRIAFTDPDALIERCEITDIDVSFGEGDLDEDAVMPLPGRWRPLTPDQATALRSGPGDGPVTVIELVRPHNRWASCRGPGFSRRRC